MFDDDITHFHLGFAKSGDNKIEIFHPTSQPCRKSLNKADQKVAWNAKARLTELQGYCHCHMLVFLLQIKDTFSTVMHLHYPRQMHLKTCIQLLMHVIKRLLFVIKLFFIQSFHFNMGHTVFVTN